MKGGEMPAEVETWENFNISNLAGYSLNKFLLSKKVLKVLSRTETLSPGTHL